MSARLLELADVRAGYDKKVVLDQLSLHVDEGEVVAMLGPNGAGKTTTVRTIFGLVRPTRGAVVYRGQRIDGATGGLSGGPFAVRHLHDINEEASTSFGNAIAADGFVFETVRHTGNLWRLVLR